MSTHSLPESSCDDFVFPTMMAPMSMSLCANLAVANSSVPYISVQARLDMVVWAPRSAMASVMEMRTPDRGLRMDGAG